MQPDYSALNIQGQVETIRWNMTNHKPTPEAIKVIEEMREAFISIGTIVAANCPDSREKSLAQTNLEQALMWAVASIARKYPELPDKTEVVSDQADQPQSDQPLDVTTNIQPDGKITAPYINQNNEETTPNAES